VQSNVITRDRKAGVQAGELFPRHPHGLRAAAQYKVGALPRRIVAPFTEDGFLVAVFLARLVVLGG